MKAGNSLDEVNRNRNKQEMAGSKSHLRRTLEESCFQIGQKHEEGKKKSSIFLQRAASNPWHPLACSSIALLSPSTFTRLSSRSMCLCLPLLMTASVMGLRAHPNPGRPHLNVAVPARTGSSGWTRVLGNTTQPSTVAQIDLLGSTSDCALLCKQSGSTGSGKGVSLGSRG